MITGWEMEATPRHRIVNGWVLERGKMTEKIFVLKLYVIHAAHGNCQGYLRDKEAQERHICGICSHKVFGHQRTD